VRFLLGDECGSPFLLLFASHSPALGGVLEKELRVLPLLVSLRKDNLPSPFRGCPRRVSAESRGKRFQGIALKTHHQFFWRLLFFFDLELREILIK